MKSPENPPDFSVIIPTCNRPEKLEKALKVLESCCPKPDEILVGIDGSSLLYAGLQQRFPSVRWTLFEGKETLGPGGIRHQLVKAASHDLIVSLDDDSWPTQPDFFSRLAAFFSSEYHSESLKGLPDGEFSREDKSKLPDMACISFRIREPDRDPYGQWPDLGLIAVYQACGCLMNKAAFLEAGGLLPIHPAYGMEEMDLSMRWHAQFKNVYYFKGIEIFHDTNLSHHQSPQLNASEIRNLGLLVFLRYPVLLWPIGILRIARRLLFSIRKRRFSGILSGICNIPIICWKYRNSRNPLTAAAINSFYDLLANPVKAI